MTICTLNVRLSGSSTGKESTYNVRDPTSIPGLGSSPGEGIGYPLQYSWVSLVAQMIKESTFSVGDLGSIPGLGRSQGAHGIPLQYSCLENPHGERSLVGYSSSGHRVRDGILNIRDITLPTKVCIVKATVFQTIMYRCESGS